MMPQTIRLRFSDQAGALDALRAAGWLTAAPETSTEIVPPIALIDGVRCDIDMIGALSKQTGTDDSGEPIMTVLNGYHVNLLWWGDGSAPVIGGEVMTPDPVLWEWLM